MLDKELLCSTSQNSSRIFANVTVCFTGISAGAPEGEQFFSAVRESGGVATKELTLAATCVVTKVNSMVHLRQNPKFQFALKLGIPVFRVEWISYCLECRKCIIPPLPERAHLTEEEKDCYIRFFIGPLSGELVCTTGLLEDENQRIERRVRLLCGTFSRKLTSRVTILAVKCLTTKREPCAEGSQVLVEREVFSLEESPKIEFARRKGIQMVAVQAIEIIKTPYELLCDIYGEETLKKASTENQRLNLTEEQRLKVASTWLWTIDETALKFDVARLAQANGSSVLAGSTSSQLLSDSQQLNIPEKKKSKDCSLEAKLTGQFTNLNKTEIASTHMILKYAHTSCIPSLGRDQIIDFIDEVLNIIKTYVVWLCAFPTESEIKVRRLLLSFGILRAPIPNPAIATHIVVGPTLERGYHTLCLPENFPISRIVHWQWVEFIINLVSDVTNYRSKLKKEQDNSQKTLPPCGPYLAYLLKHQMEVSFMRCIDTLFRIHTPTPQTRHKEEKYKSINSSQSPVQTSLFSKALTNTGRSEQHASVLVQTRSSNNLNLDSNSQTTKELLSASCHKLLEEKIGLIPSGSKGVKYLAQKGAFNCGAICIEPTLNGPCLVKLSPVFTTFAGSYIPSQSITLKEIMQQLGVGKAEFVRIEQGEIVANALQRYIGVILKSAIQRGELQQPLNNGDIIELHCYCFKPQCNEYKKSGGVSHFTSPTTLTVSIDKILDGYKGEIILPVNVTMSTITFDWLLFTASALLVNSSFLRYKPFSLLFNPGKLPSCFQELGELLYQIPCAIPLLTVPLDNHDTSFNDPANFYVNEGGADNKSDTLSPHGCLMNIGILIFCHKQLEKMIPVSRYVISNAIKRLECTPVLQKEIIYNDISELDTFSLQELSAVKSIKRLVIVDISSDFGFCYAPTQLSEDLPDQSPLSVKTSENIKFCFIEDSLVFNKNQNVHQERRGSLVEELILNHLSPVALKELIQFKCFTIEWIAVSSLMGKLVSESLWGGRLIIDFSSFKNKYCISTETEIDRKRLRELI